MGEDMGDFLGGVLVGVVLIIMLANLTSSAQKKQCQLGHIGKRCELLWIPTKPM